MGCGVGVDVGVGSGTVVGVIVAAGVAVDVGVTVSSSSLTHAADSTATVMDTTAIHPIQPSDRRRKRNNMANTAMRTLVFTIIVATKLLALCLPVWKSLLQAKRTGLQSLLWSVQGCPSWTTLLRSVVDIFVWILRLVCLSARNGFMLGGKQLPIA